MKKQSYFEETSSSFKSCNLSLMASLHCNLSPKVTTTLCYIYFTPNSFQITETNCLIFYISFLLILFFTISKAFNKLLKSLISSKLPSYKSFIYLNIFIYSEDKIIGRVYYYWHIRVIKNTHSQIICIKRIPVRLLGQVEILFCCSGNLFCCSGFVDLFLRVKWGYCC